METIINHKFVKATILFLLGALCVLGFAPYNIYPASTISLIGLMYFWCQNNTPKQAALSGFIYGLGLYCVGIYWIYISLHEFGNMPSLFASLATFLLCAFMALFPTLVGVLSITISGNQSNKLIFAVPILWALSDWIRSWIFTGFPWLTMGYSQVPNSPLAGYIPIMGIYGVSMVVVFFSCALGFLLAKKAKTLLWKRGVIAALIITWLGGSLLKLIEWSNPTSKPISVALLQGNIPQNIKWTPEVAVQTLNEYLNMTEASSAQLIIMPETAMPVISSQIPKELLSRIKSQAIKNHGAVLVGTVEHEYDQYYNSMLSIGGSNTEVYRKSHLVPFGEFIPLKVAFGWIYRDLLNMPLSDLTRGSIYQRPMSLDGEKVAINICYEDVFGEEIIRQLPEATLLVNASNDAWYGQSNASFQHMQFSQARALETGRTVLRATNTGATSIIDPHGIVLAQAPRFSQITLEGMAQGYNGSTPYVRWGNWLFLAICLTGLIALCLPNFLATRRKTK